eukprot:TRINITY_DN13795_c0_g1_i1.p1 TRINITY_DN13795_c0_g1~~TRINITY_DN13795_c0_g1_i1.p1  ORF type:complete len:1545 (-),score=151.55 TRINITY_DN13795_c0_g1_i1:291-4925(-)
MTFASLAGGGEFMRLMNRFAIVFLTTRNRANGQIQDCYGYNEEIGECAGQPACETCEPSDCLFGEWNDWMVEGGCSNLAISHRRLERINNECGKPCQGTLIRSKVSISDECRSDLVPCEFVEWSQWSKCTPLATQSQRTRSVVTGKSFEEACEGSLEETRPCDFQFFPQDCEFSPWEPWSNCPSTCGGGLRVRERAITLPASNGGAPCKNMTRMLASCNLPKCPDADCQISEWSVWSVCDKATAQRFRSRSVQKHALGQGRRCGASLSETAGCPLQFEKTEAFGEWEAWSNCSRNCGGGARSRSRSIQSVQAINASVSEAGFPATQMVEPCREEPCSGASAPACSMSSWSPWSECEQKCGNSTMTRSRKIVDFAPSDQPEKGCVGAISEMQICVKEPCAEVDCVWGGWEAWSGCSMTCGGGYQTRGRVIERLATDGGKLCDPLTMSEMQSCNADSCEEGCVDGQWGEWSVWSACSASCDAGYKVRSRRESVMPNHCGKPPGGLLQDLATCTGLKSCTPDVNCTVSDWSKWSVCTRSCFGIQERSRTILKFAAGGGNQCQDVALSELAPCNPAEGEVSPTCGKQPSVDCVLSAWSDWTNCSLTCGGGQKKKSRTIVRSPANGGKTCDPELSIVAACNTEPCKAGGCADCKWGQWTEWGVCSGCNGFRWRYRSVAQFPNKCGRSCDAKANRQVAPCDVDCAPLLACSWSDWSISHCPTTCGSSPESRVRTLSTNNLVPSTDSRNVSEAASSHLFIGSERDSRSCVASQKLLDNCTVPEKCKQECVPVNCSFGPWSEWGSSTCAGLRERSREISSFDNDCGMPCSGPLTETQRSVSDCANNTPVDCILSDWADWESCASGYSQKVRSREVVQTVLNEGKPCVGPLQETTVCDANLAAEQPCKFSSWSDWAACSVTCGSGVHVRTRIIATMASPGSVSCAGSTEEVKACTEGNCTAENSPCVFSDWSLWSTCTAQGDKSRDRSIQSPARGSGNDCSGSMQEIMGCNDNNQSNCSVSEWGEWGDCDASCGGGQRSRDRKNLRCKDCPPVMTETEGCNTDTCPGSCKFGDWGEWSACSASCGAGSQARDRSVAGFRSRDGAGCVGELIEHRDCQGTQKCPSVNCSWGDWQSWDTCTRSCDGGQRFRSRSIAQFPLFGGVACSPSDMQEVGVCSTQRCSQMFCKDGAWSEWLDWSSCSATCTSGVRFRSRTVLVPANECGRAASGTSFETEFCNSDVPCVPSIDCLLSTWGDWSGCTSTCDGTMQRRRDVTRYGAGFGKFCTGGLNEVGPCNSGCGKGTPVDCVLTAWTDWTGCTATCGPGQRSRHRRIGVLSKFGGRECKGIVEEAAGCSREPCPLSGVVDCAISDWSEWGACDRCGGQRSRSRNVERYPRNGGLACPSFNTEMSEPCPFGCSSQMYCVWQDWLMWGGCSARCGNGLRKRRRYLGLTHEASNAPADLTLVHTYNSLLSGEQSIEVSERLPVMLGAFACGCLSVVGFLAVCRVTSSMRRRRWAATQDRTLPDDRHSRADEGDFGVQLPLVGSGEDTDGSYM